MGEIIVKIMIADDHPLFADGLKNLLEVEDFEITGIVKDGEKAVEMALEKRPDVILMDIQMPDVDGIEATEKIKKEVPKTRILILTSFEEEDNLFKAIKAGASGYLLKSLDGEELVESLKEIEKGKNPFSPGLEDSLLDEFRKSEQRAGKNKESNKENDKTKEDVELTERQLEVIKLVGEGLTYQEVADELYLSERTIKYHMEQIKKKLFLKNKAEVIAYAKSYSF